MDETEDEDQYDKQMKELEVDFGDLGLGIVGTAANINEVAEDSQPGLAK